MKTLTIEHIAPSFMGYKCLSDSGEVYELTPSHFPSNWRDVPFKHRLILVPLDKLTDAQYAEVGRITWLDFVSAKSWLVNDGYLAAFPLDEAAQVLQYLHSIKADVRSLIPAGLAISAYDLPENPYDK